MCMYCCRDSAHFILSTISTNGNAMFDLKVIDVIYQLKSNSQALAFICISDQNMFVIKKLLKKCRYFKMSKPF